MNIFHVTIVFHTLLMSFLRPRPVIVVFPQFQVHKEIKRVKQSY
jgi:hypothetical protein